MTIKLGLERMGALYAQQQPKWKSIHVAGTNGKGSICSYISALLTRKNIAHGRFTSPFIRRPEDSILINNKPIPSDMFRQLYESAGNLTKDPATHFERMTYAAFKAFDHFEVKYGVVETGLGGRLDATNILNNKAVTVISKIGLDHQEYLGNSIQEIATEKAGIMREGVSCVINHHNGPEATEAILKKANEVAAKPILTTPGNDLGLLGDQVGKVALDSQPWPQFMVDNAMCALLACKQLEEFEGDNPIINHLGELPRSPMEGRLQFLDISGTFAGASQGRTAPIILDGAHNADGWHALTSYVSENFRGAGDDRVVWIVAVSGPRKNQMAELFRSLPQNDTVICTMYNHLRKSPENPSYHDLPIAFRPQPVDNLELRQSIISLPGEKPYVRTSRHLSNALHGACKTARGPRQRLPQEKDCAIVVTGSVYLVSDLLNWLDSESSRKRPPTLRRQLRIEQKERRRDSGEEHKTKEAEILEETW